MAVPILYDVRYPLIVSNKFIESLVLQFLGFYLPLFFFLNNLKSKKDISRVIVSFFNENKKHTVVVLTLCGIIVTHSCRTYI